MKTLTFREGITRIEAYQFQNRTDFERVVFPGTLQYIGERAFSGCTNLKEVVFPPYVAVIKGYVFESCRNLEKVIMPQKVDYLGSGVFEYCTSLKHIDIPGGIKSVPRDFCYDCQSIKVVRIPEGIDTIEKSAFWRTDIELYELPSTLRFFDDLEFLNSYDRNVAVYLPSNVPHNSCPSASVRVGRNEHAYHKAAVKLVTKKDPNPDILWSQFHIDQKAQILLLIKWIFLGCLAGNLVPKFLTLFGSAALAFSGQYLAFIAIFLLCRMLYFDDMYKHLEYYGQKVEAMFNRAD